MEKINDVEQATYKKAIEELRVNEREVEGSNIKIDLAEVLGWEN